MRVQIVDRTGELAEQDLQALQRRLLFQLTRYGTRIDLVRLEFDEQRDKTRSLLRCRGLITTQDDRQVRVDDTDHEYCRCGFRVADRLSRSMARLVHPQGFHRGPLPPLQGVGLRASVTRRG
ncbi:MAG: hypothetical protein EA424_09915 [Planctomycetaceae bacterium]|nr:MAG: hypothetical protein EA424_09915 [Planctomycetaceae bacterium]